MRWPASGPCLAPRFALDSSPFPALQPLCEGEEVVSYGFPLIDMVGVATSKLNALALARITGDIARNVNFAVQPAVALEFLRSAGITPAERPSSRRLSVADVTEAAKRSTMFLRCCT